MTAFIEVRCEGDARAIIEAGAIAGIVTSKESRIDRIADPKNPLRVILRGGETVDVYGETAAEVIVRATAIKKEVRDHGFDIKCDLIDGKRSPRLAYALAIVTGMVDLPPELEQFHAEDAAAD